MIKPNESARATATPPRPSARRPTPLPRNPRLRFNPTAWAKLVWFCDHGQCEIGGFGITDPADPLYLTDFVTVRQQAGVASVSFDDAAVADYVDGQVDRGLRPESFLRLWLHTHPGDSPTPSGTDEETFARVFGKCDWAIMFVLARTGKTYARLRFNVGPGGHGEIPVEVDWSAPFAASDHDGWRAEYRANVRLCPTETGLLGDPGGQFWGGDVPSRPASARRRHGGDGKSLIEPFGAEAAELMADALDFDESWSDLLYRTDWQDLDAAAEEVAVRWGLVDFSEWPEAVHSLPPDEQRQFRAEVEAEMAESNQGASDLTVS